MPQPSQKLAAALLELKTLQDGGLLAIPGRSLSRQARQALLRAGFLRPVVRGWYIPRHPEDDEGDSTAWYASLREFIAAYATHRYGERWHLGPEQSVLLHSGERTVPRQVHLWAMEGSNQPLALPHESSIFIYRAPRLLPSSVSADSGGLRLAELSAALVATSPTFYRQHPDAAQIAMGSLADASDLIRTLLEGPHPAVAGRIAGAMRAIGRPEVADGILGAMRSAGHAVTESNPFASPHPGLLHAGRPDTATALRLRLLWATMRDAVRDAFPPPRGVASDTREILDDIEARYVTDAYHSLSIEGYRVTAGLIEKVRDGQWNPDGEERDRAARDAMAASGYHQAHALVKEDLVRIVRGGNAGAVLREALPRWHRALFAPSVQAGIVTATDLAGYRNDAVFIRGARHVPPSKDAVREGMPVLFELLEQEPLPQVRAVLGHFLFVYIHPYGDGNGRLGRFLMNLMLASAGYPWTVIPIERRSDYMDALEEASSRGNIVAFAKLVAELATSQSKGPLARPR